MTTDPLTLAPQPSPQEAFLASPADIVKTGDWKPG